MQRDRFVVARTWLRSAERDASVARLILDAEPALAAFHAQQAAEKALKAVAVAASDDHPRTHATGTLVDELTSLGIAIEPELAAHARSLDLYYLAARYPDAVLDGDPGEAVPVEDARRAIDRSDRLRAFAAGAVERFVTDAT